MDVNEYSLKELAAKFDLTIIGDSSLTIKGVCGISDNTANSLSFITDTTKIKNAKELFKNASEICNFHPAVFRAPAHCTSASVFQTTSILFFLYVMKISLQPHTLLLNS